MYEYRLLAMVQIRQQ